MTTEFIEWFRYKLTTIFGAQQCQCFYNATFYENISNSSRNDEIIEFLYKKIYQMRFIDELIINVDEDTA